MSTIIVHLAFIAAGEFLRRLEKGQSWKQAFIYGGLLFVGPVKYLLLVETVFHMITAVCKVLH